MHRRYLGRHTTLPLGVESCVTIHDLQPANRLPVPELLRRWGRFAPRCRRFAPTDKFAALPKPGAYWQATHGLNKRPCYVLAIQYLYIKYLICYREYSSFHIKNCEYIYIPIQPTRFERFRLNINRTITLYGMLFIKLVVIMGFLHLPLMIAQVQ